MLNLLRGVCVDSVIPVQAAQSVSSVLGVLGCLRNVIPHMSVGEAGEEEMRGSFGVRRCHQETQSAVDRMIQVSPKTYICKKIKDMF